MEEHGVVIVVVVMVIAKGLKVRSYSPNLL
jgi:hypothetical protein